MLNLRNKMVLSSNCLIQIAIQVVMIWVAKTLVMYSTCSLLTYIHCTFSLYVFLLVIMSNKKNTVPYFFTVGIERWCGQPHLWQPRCAWGQAVATPGHLVQRDSSDKGLCSNPIELTTRIIVFIVIMKHTYTKTWTG